MIKFNKQTNSFIRKSLCLLCISLLSLNVATAQQDFGSRKWRYDGDGFLDLAYTTGIDELRGSHMLGTHWPGEELPVDGINNVYLVNCATGEYLVLGDTWGTSTMTDHVGTRFKITKSPLSTMQTCRADIGTDMAGKGFLLQANVKELHTLGRTAISGGTAGTFEHNRTLFTRDADKEYQLNYMESGDTRPGAFIWYFVPAGKTEQGGTKYFIYTHRQTRLPLALGQGTNDPDYFFNYQQMTEYNNRDSYLCLSSTKSAVGDYKKVIYNKFAGQMWYDETDTKYLRELYTKFRVQTNSDLLDIPVSLKGKENATEAEQEFESKIVSFKDGFDKAIEDDANLWKIVTYDERKRYRLTASIDNPVDVSFNIKNHKFYTLYTYAPQTTGGTVENYEWTWHESDLRDAPQLNTYPWRPDYSQPVKDFHKIGTGFYDRYGYGTNDEGSGYGTRQREVSMTLGLEGNYCASLYKKSGNLRQTITNLRPGYYVVYCRAFFAPHDMMKISNDGTTTTVASPYTEDDVKEHISSKFNSHDSYLFAWTEPIENVHTEYKRRLPSIWDGLTPKSKMTALSREPFFNDLDTFQYTTLGQEIKKFDMATWREREQNGIKNGKRYDHMLDKFAYAIIPKDWIGATEDHYVPRNIFGAGRFFNATDPAVHPEANKYRIGIPVEVGPDGELTIGIEHTYTDTPIAGDDVSSFEDEWVCFDEFELVYLGPAVPEEFLIDESKPVNNTISYDCFDYIDKYTEGGEDKERTLLPADGPITRKLLIKRTLNQDTWTPINLPVALTKAEVKEAFGKDTKLSVLKSLVWTTIYYEKVDLDGNQTDIAIEPNKPYIIIPSKFPEVSKEGTYTRQVYPKDYVKSDTNFNNSKRVVLRVGRDNLVDKELQGPLYIVENYVVNKNAVFPNRRPQSELGAGKTPYYSIMAADEWVTLQPYQPQAPVKLVGDDSGDTYKLTGNLYYTALGEASKGEGIPPYSYYHSGGKMYFTGEKRANAKKGFGFYITLNKYDSSGASTGVFEHSLFDGNWTFEEIVPTDIETVTTTDDRYATDTWYTIEGVRLNGQPTVRGMYIYNGRKVVVGQ